MAAPDEYRYAEIPREMLENRDWVLPQLDGMPYFEKPVLGYWATAVSMKVFGKNIFAARLPSALGSGLAALLIAYLLRAFPDRRSGALGAAIFLTSLLPLAAGTTAILDGLFTAFLTLALVAFFSALEGEERRQGFPLAIAGIGIGLAFLTKGFLAIVLPGLVLLPYLFVTRSLGTFLRRSWIPLAWFVLIAAPWSVTAGLRSEFWQHFFWVEHIQRFLDPGENQHVEAFWFYLPQLAASIVPWLGLLVPAVVGLKRLETPSLIRLRFFAACWVLAPLLFFSLSSGKLVTYILPCIPPLVILFVLGLSRYLQMGGRRLLNYQAFLLLLLGAATLGYLLWGWRTSDEIAVLILGDPMRLVFLVLGSVLSFVFALASLSRRTSGQRLVLMISSAVFCFAGWMTAFNSGILRSPGALIRAVGPEHAEGRLLVGDGNTVQALCWETRRTDVEVFGNPTELAYGLSRDPDRELLDLPALKRKASEATRGTWLLLEKKKWRSIAAEFPSWKELHGDRHYILVELGLTPEMTTKARLRIEGAAAPAASAPGHESTLPTSR